MLLLDRLNFSQLTSWLKALSIFSIGGLSPQSLTTVASDALLPVAASHLAMASFINVPLLMFSQLSNIQVGKYYWSEYAVQSFFFNFFFLTPNCVIQFDVIIVLLFRENGERCGSSFLFFFLVAVTFVREEYSTVYVHISPTLVHQVCEQGNDRLHRLANLYQEN